MTTKSSRPLLIAGGTGLRHPLARAFGGRLTP